MINKHIFISLATVLLMLSIFIFFIVFVHVSVNMDELKTKTFDTYNMEEILSLKDDGTYVGTYDAFPLSVEVEVFIKNHQIDDVMIKNKSLFFNDEAKNIIDSIKENLSIDLTFSEKNEASEKALILAIIDALEE